MLSPPNHRQSPTSPTLAAATSQPPEPSNKFISHIFSFDNKVTKTELFRFFIYVILLFIIVYQNLDITLSYAQNTYFLSLLSDSEGLNILAPTYKADLQASLEANIENLIKYNENSFIIVQNTDNFTVFDNYLLLKPITDLRIVQTRVKTFNNGSIIWKNPLEEDKAPYGLNESQFFFYDNENEGYPVYLPLFSVENYSKEITEQALKSWENIKSDGFFDAHTHIITIDFAYISLSLNIVTYMKIISEIKPSGIAKTTVDVRTFNFGFFGTQSNDSQRALYIFYVIFFGYYFFVMFIKIYYDIKHVEFDDDHTKNNNNTELNKQSSVIIRKIEVKFNELTSNCKGTKRFVARVIIGMKRHLSQTRNLIDLFVNIMNIFLIWITLKLLFTEDFFKLMDQISLNSNSDDFIKRNPNNIYIKQLNSMNDRLDLLSNNLMNYQMYCAMIILVQCFKIFIYVIGFSKSIQRFFAIISNILDVLFFYLLLIAVIFLSFVLLIRNYYGYQIPDFTNIYSVSVYLFGMISGYNENLTIMWNNSPEFTLFFEIAFNFIIVFILMNMFLVIVKNEFSHFQLEMNRQQEAKNNENHTRFHYKQATIYQIKDKLLSWSMFFLKYLNKEKYQKNKQKEMDRELDLQNDINLYSHIDFDVNFVDMLKKFQNNEEKNTLVETEKARLALLQANALVKGIWRLFSLMIVLALYIFLVTEFFQTEENYYLSSSVVQKLEKPYTDPQNSKLTKTLSQANNINDILYFLSYEFPSFFSQKIYYNGDKNIINDSYIKENPSFNEFMFLANQKIRFTVRKRKGLVNQNYFKEVIPSVIAPSFSYDLSNPINEETNNINLNTDMKITYDKAKSFNGYGGYVFFVNPVESLKEKIVNLTESKFFDNKLNSITLDFVLIHVIKNKFVYVLLILQFGDTGGVDIIYQALPYRRINYSSTLDISITVLLSLLLLAYTVSVVKFIKAIFFKAESYQTWYVMFIKHTIPESLLHHRERKNPEFLRKIAYVFDFKSLLNIFFFLFAGVFIFLMGFLQASVLEIENKTNIFGVDLAELMKLTSWRVFENLGSDEEFLGEFMNLSVSLMVVLDTIAIFAAFSAFVMVFQILYYYSQKNSFFVIIQSILISLREIPFMIAVLLSFLFTFALYGFLLLGKIHHKFNTFPNAARTLFEYLTHIDDIAFFMEESSMLAFFTLLLPFFLSVKLVLINMFFSIIYRAYEKSKSDGKNNIKPEVSIGFKAFWVITYKLLTNRNEEKDNSIEMYSHLVQKTEIEELFLRMKDTIRISNQNTNIHIWANICSEEIRNEHEKRSFLKEKCDEIMKNYFFKNSEGDHRYFKLLGRNLNKKCIEYELRKNYWDYFRIAHQYLNRYDFYFNNRIKELNERLKNKEQIEKERDRENIALKQYIADLIKRMEENKTDLGVVKKEIRRLRDETDMNIGDLMLEEEIKNEEEEE